MPKILLATAISLALPIAANAREPRQPDTGQAQIACTVSGCVPIPAGCRRVPGRSPDDFDRIVCPPGVQPYR